MKIKSEKAKISFAEKVLHFLDELPDIAKNPTRASDIEVQRRKAICDACENWNKRGNLGFGECKICGCSRAKIYLKISQCPKKMW